MRPPLPSGTSRFHCRVLAPSTKPAEEVWQAAQSPSARIEVVAHLAADGAGHHRARRLGTVERAEGEPGEDRALLTRKGRSLAPEMAVLPGEDRQRSAGALQADPGRPARPRPGWRRPQLQWRRGARVGACARRPDLPDRWAARRRAGKAPLGGERAPDHQPDRAALRRWRTGRRRRSRPPRAHARTGFPRPGSAARACRVGLARPGQAAGAAGCRGPNGRRAVAVSRSIDRRGQQIGLAPVGPPLVGAAVGAARTVEHQHARLEPPAASGIALVGRQVEVLDGDGAGREGPAPFADGSRSRVPGGTNSQRLFSA